MKLQNLRGIPPVTTYTKEELTAKRLRKERKSKKLCTIFEEENF